MNTEIIKEAIKTILTFIEISRVINEKQIAIKDQDYQRAYDLRCKEVELQEQLPSEERLKELYELL
jgi:hypothetical protein